MRPQFVSQFEVIANLPVIGDPTAFVRGRHRLVAAKRQVHDRKSAMPESDRIGVGAGCEGVLQLSPHRKRLLLPSYGHEGIPLPVRAPVRLDLRHGFQHVEINRPAAGVVDARYAAHVR